MQSEYETEETHAGLETADMSLTDSYERAASAIRKDDRPEPAPRTVSDGDISVTIEGDVTGNSTCTGEYSDFRKYFKSKLEKLTQVLEKHNFDATPQSISSLDRLKTNRGPVDVTVIGSIYEMFESQNGNQVIKLDDPTGTVIAVFNDEETKEYCQRHLLNDEIIAIQGQYNGEIIYGDSIELPEVPPTNRTNTADVDAEVVLISDTHFGSQEFAAQKWNMFVDWIHQRERVKYILISGDIVEGIGVYPGQKDELLVNSIEEQYKLAGEAFEQLPDSVEIITSVGNHDSVRLAEPQPALPEKFTQHFPDNVTVTGNPVTVNIEGVRFLLYHGMSLNPLIEKLYGLDIHEPEQAMIPLLKKRHLAPVWGEGIRIAPEHDDYLSISNVPDVLHCGHVHTYGYDKYRDVNVVNTGCWQERTDYQKSKNVFPDVGHAPVFDLQTSDIQEYSF